MIPADVAVCRNPPGYPCCLSCRRNLDNHDKATQLAVRKRDRQQMVEPDTRENCRHWSFLSIPPKSPEDKL